MPAAAAAAAAAAVIPAWQGNSPGSACHGMLELVQLRHILPHSQQATSIVFLQHCRTFQDPSLGVLSAQHGGRSMTSLIVCV